VPRLTQHELLGADSAETSADVRDRVLSARERQQARYSGMGVTCNAHLPGPIARRRTELSEQAQAMIGRAVEDLALSGRGVDRVVKVARTIADLAGRQTVASEHVAEALAYRTTFGTQEVLPADAVAG
jgi:magnesium chelatase family protein